LKVYNKASLNSSTVFWFFKRHEMKKCMDCGQTVVDGFRLVLMPELSVGNTWDFDQIICR
jgi:hypothetical protein